MPLSCHQSASTVGQDIYPYGEPSSPPLSPHEAQSIFSKDIWLGDNQGESQAFARAVEIAGWSSVGDKRGGAYVGEFCARFCVSAARLTMLRSVYDCVIKTKEVRMPLYSCKNLDSPRLQGIAVHALKRYSAFAQLAARLRATLPVSVPPSIPGLKHSSHDKP